jgi:hypothetical protein
MSNMRFLPVPYVSFAAVLASRRDTGPVRMLDWRRDDIANAPIGKSFARRLRRPNKPVLPGSEAV